MEGDEVARQEGHGQASETAGPGGGPDAAAPDQAPGPTLKRLYWRFYKAARRRNAEALLRLIREHPELHDCDGPAGRLWILLEVETPELVESALEAGLHPDAGPPGMTLLQGAACEGDVEKMRLLLRHGADPEKRNEDGETALGYACAWGHLEAVRVLVEEAGADVNAVEERPDNGYRNTALECCGRERPEIAAYLRGKGAKLLSELEG